MRSILAAVVRSPMKSRRRFLNDLGLIAALTVGATALRYAFNPDLGTRAPFLFHVLTVAIGAQIAGLAPGLISTGMSLLLIRYFFAPPYHSLGRPADPQFGVALLLFAVVGIALSIFGEWRKRTADEVRRIRYNLETAQHIANIGSWESDLDGKLWWSNETYRIFGIPPGVPLQNDDFFALVHSEDRDAVRQAVATALETNTDYDVEHRIIRRSDGQLRHVHQQAKVLLLKNGTTQMIGSIQDITDTRRGEQAEQILGGLLQVCSACRRIRDEKEDDEEWYSMEGYLRLHTPARFSHGMCPDCSKQWTSEGRGGSGQKEGRR